MPEDIWESDIHEERMTRFVDAGLYLVTSGVMSAGRTTHEIVEAALTAGVGLIQLREKNMPLKDLVPLAGKIRGMTAEAGALLIINDRIDVAMAVGADGVHLGQDDFPIRHARRLAPDMIIGASSHSTGEASEAELAGASYVNIGPLFSTNTKEWGKEYLGIEGLEAISKVLSVPFTVMGGIKLNHIEALKRSGARVMAVVTAVTAADDPVAAAGELLKRIRATLHA
jgi:thiamine-phosphate pyrophosphorylase